MQNFNWIQRIWQIKCKNECAFPSTTAMWILKSWLVKINSPVDAIKPLQKKSHQTSNSRKQCRWKYGIYVCFKYYVRKTTDSVLHTDLTFPPRPGAKTFSGFFDFVFQFLLSHSGLVYRNYKRGGWGLTYIHFQAHIWSCLGCLEQNSAAFSRRTLFVFIFLFQPAACLFLKHLEGEGRTDCIIIRRWWSLHIIQNWKQLYFVLSLLPLSCHVHA